MELVEEVVRERFGIGTMRRWLRQWFIERWIMRRGVTEEQKRMLRLAIGKGEAFAIQFAIDETIRFKLIRGDEIIMIGAVAGPLKGQWFVEFLSAAELPCPSCGELMEQKGIERSVTCRHCRETFNVNLFPRAPAGVCSAVP